MNTLFSFMAFSLLTLQLAEAQMTVTGTLLGHDDKPMAIANVILTTEVQSLGPAVKVVDAGKDGKYSITVDTAGMWALWFAGVDHISHVVPLYVDKPKKISLDVQLKTYDYIDTLSEVKIEGKFNHFNPNTAIPMKKQPDGTFITEFDAKADSAFEYEIVGVTKDEQPINGTQSERYVYDGRGGYQSVLTPTNGKVKIVFDPAKLVRSDEPVKVVFADSESFEAKFAETYDEMQQEEAAWTTEYLQYKKSGKDVNRFKYDWSKTLGNLQQRLNNEASGMLRQELYLNYIWLNEFGADVDSSYAVTALREDSAASWIWSLDPFLFIVALDQAGVMRSEFDKHIKDFIERNPCNSYSKPLVLYEEFYRAKYMNDSEKAATCYDLLVNKYGDSPSAKMVKARFSTEAKVAVGKPVPAFSVALLEDSTKVFTNESFKGKYYLIDFWATWCGPCVAEMQYLHKAHERFKDKNFVMLSVSLDTSPDDVIRFRQSKWPLPWFQAFARNAWNTKMVKDFETVGIPHSILVDTTGTIVAIDENLRGEKLEETIEKYLGKLIQK